VTGKYTMEMAFRDSLLDIEEIDSMAEAMEKDRAVLRRRVDDLRKMKFQLKDMEFLKRENEALKNQEKVELDLSLYCEPFCLTEDSLKVPPSKITLKFYGRQSEGPS
jgi:hypothetical protein